ncbi:MAG: RNA 3-phosphate cyclase, partial [Sphingomonas hengshuiensis]
WQHRTRPRYAETVRASQAPTRSASAALSDFEAMVLMAIAYFQPVTRAELSRVFGKEISRDTIASLRNAGFLASGPRSPTPGAPYTYVTTKQFLTAFGMQTLRDLPDIEALEDAGLLSRQAVQTEAVEAGVETDAEGEEP